MVAEKKRRCFNVTRGLLNKTSEAHFKSCFAFHGNKHCVAVTGRDGFRRFLRMLAGDAELSEHIERPSSVSLSWRSYLITQYLLSGFTRPTRHSIEIKVSE